MHRNYLRMLTKTYISFNVNFVVFSNRLFYRRRFSFPLLLATSAADFRQVDEREGGFATVIKTRYFVGGKGFIIVVVVDATVTGVVVRWSGYSGCWFERWHNVHGLVRRHLMEDQWFVFTHPFRLGEVMVMVALVIMVVPNRGGWVRREARRRRSGGWYRATGYIGAATGRRCSNVIV